MSVSFASGPDGAYILYCTSTGAPSPTVEWHTPSGSNISTSLFNSSLSNALILDRTYSLELEPTNDLLDYTCTATSVFNGMTWTANDSILLNTGKQLKIFNAFIFIVSMSHFLEPPILIFDSGPVVEVIHGSSLTLTCTAHGRPIPSFMWYHNGMELGLDEVLSLEIAGGDLVTSRLTIDRVSYHSHRGDYSCVASSSVGTDSALIEVIVKCELLQRVYVVVESFVV